MDNQDRSVLTRFFIGLAIVIVIIVLVWIFFFRSTAKKNDNQPARKASETSQPANGSPSTPASPKDSSAAATPPQKNASGTAPQALADTGPGEPVMLFALATIGGGILHHMYRRIKQMS